MGLRAKPALSFLHWRLRCGKGGDEFVQDGGAVGFFGSQRPVGIMGIDHAEMTRVQMRQHPDEFGVTVSTNRVSGF